MGLKAASVHGQGDIVKTGHFCCAKCGQSYYATKLAPHCDSQHGKASR